MGTQGLATMKLMECTTNRGERRATLRPTSTGRARTLTLKCTAARRTWKPSGQTRGLWRTRASRAQKVGLVAVPGLVRCSLRRRRMILSVWTHSCTRPSRPAAARGRTTTDETDATIGEVLQQEQIIVLFAGGERETGRGGRITTK